MTQPAPYPSNAVADRSQLLHDNGYGWLDPNVQATLASGQSSDQGMLGAAGQMASALVDPVRNGAASALSFARTVFDDPVLHKQPSLALQLHQIVTQQMGWLPVSAPSLDEVQRNMQSQGYGHGLALNGVWSADWQQAYYQMGQDHYQAHATSNGGMGFSFGKAFHGFLNAFMPSHAIPTLVGVLKAMPGDIRTLAADSVGSVVNTPHAFMQGIEGKGDWRTLVESVPNPFGVAAYASDKHPGGAAASTSAAIEGLGNHRRITADTVSQEHGWNRAIEDVNTILAMIPAMRLGTGVAEAGGQAVARGLFTDMGKGAAARGPGLISNMVYQPAGQIAGEQIGARGLLAMKAFDNIPGLRGMIPAVRTGVEAGQRYWYYTARPWAAAPYRLPIVQAAGQAAQSTLLTSALYRGDAVAVNHIEGGQSPFAHTVEGQKPYTGPVGLALDIMGGLAHGELPPRTPLAANTQKDVVAQSKAGTDYRPLILPKATDQIGATVRAAHDVYDTMLGKPGVIGAWERGTGLKYAAVLKQFRSAGLDSTDLNGIVQAKVDNLAAEAGAREATRNNGLLGHEGEQAFLDARQAIRSDPAQLAPHRAALVDSDAALATAFRMDSSRIRQRPQDATADLVQYAKARREAMKIVGDPASAKLLIHGGTFQAIKDARADATFDAEMNGQAAPAKVTATAGWLGAHNPPPVYGSVGMGRVDSLTRPKAVAALTRIGKQITAAKAVHSVTTDSLLAGEDFHAADTAALDSARKELGDLLVQMHVDPTSLPTDPDILLAAARERANHLASPVALPLDAPDHVRQAFDTIKEHGYQLVSGKGIGFDFAPPVIDPVHVEGGIRTVRKVAERLGVGSTYSDPEDVAAWHRRDWIDQLLKHEQAGRLSKLPGWTWDHVISQIADNVPNKQHLVGLRGAVYGLVKDTRWRNIAKAMLPDGASESDITAKLQAIEEQMASHRAMLDLSLPQFTAAATKPAKGLVNFLSGVPDEAPMFSEKQARLIYLSMVRAAASKPMWLVGLSKLDGFTRAGASFFGAATANSRVTTRLATAGNDFIRLRNKIRFDLDPEFSARRLAKQGLKLSMEGVPFTVTPFDSMVKQGTLAEDLKLADRLFPQSPGVAEGFDALDHTLQDADLFGFYNPRHVVAYGAGWFRRMGMNDDQVKAAVTRTTGYGSRTALERSLGTVFYPFSFEKTLYRQLGRYLLDEPGKRFMLASGLQAYDALSKHADIGQWLTDHAPLLSELQRLNAFEHGVGPGMLGGINAPYAGMLWNLFGPQRIPSNRADRAAKAWTQAVPVLGELNRMLIGYDANSGKRTTGSLVDQGRITWQATRNGVDDATRSLWGQQRSPWNPQGSTLSYQAQQQHGSAMRVQLITQLSAAIDYNYHHPNAPMTIADDPSVPESLRGAKVDRTTVDQIVHLHYPDYDPNAAKQIATVKQQQITDFVNQLPASRRDGYAGFVKMADRFVAWKQRREFTPDQWAQIAAFSQQFRDYALRQSEQDPTFYAFYKRYYSSRLGPLEGLTG